MRSVLRMAFALAPRRAPRAMTDDDDARGDAVVRPGVVGVSLAISLAAAAAVVVVVVNIAHDDDDARGSNDILHIMSLVVPNVITPARARTPSSGARSRWRSNSTPPVATGRLVRDARRRASARDDDDDDLSKRLEFNLNDELEADIAKYAAKKAEDDAASSVVVESTGEKAMGGVKEAIDTFLLYDFFVILFILAWLIVGVCVRLSKGNGLSFDEPFLGTWLFLWPFLFQPLLGVHMLATLVSPAIGWAKKKQLLSDDVWQ